MPMILKMSLFVPIDEESLEKLQHCVMAVSAYMTGSKLKLNPSNFFSSGPNFGEKKS